MLFRVTVVCFLSIWLAASGPDELIAQQAEQRPVTGVIYDLTHPEAKRRRQAAVALGQHKVRAAVPALIEATEDPDESVRLEALRALVRISDTRALKAYIRLTQEPKKEIQEKAIEGIINVYVVDEGGFVQGVQKVVDFVNPFSDDYNPLTVEPYMPVSQDAVNALAALLTSKHDGIRKDAAMALGILRAHSALPQIKQALGRETDNNVKVELIRSVYKIGDPEAAKAVLPFIRDAEKKVHDEAIFTVGRLRLSDAVPQLNELYASGVEERKKLFGLIPASRSDDLQRKVLEALSYIGDSRSRDHFVNALQDSRDFYRRCGAEGLGRVGDQSYATEIGKKYVRETTSEVKLAMSYALYRLGRGEHLLELVDNIGRDQAYFYLLELSPQEVQTLYPELKTASGATKARLLDVIGLRADSSALPVVQEMMQSEDAKVVSAANLAMRRLRARVSG